MAGGHKASGSRVPPDNSVGAAKLKADAVETAKVADLAVTKEKLGWSAVSTGKIADSAVTDAKLRNSNPRTLIGRAGSTTGVVADIPVGSGTGAVMRENAGTIGWGTVGTEGLRDGALSADLVGRAKMADGYIVEAKVGTGAITETKIGSGAVTETKIGAGAVTETKIGAGAVTRAKLVNDAKKQVWRARVGALGGAAGSSISAGQTRYAAVLGDAALNATESNVQVRALTAGTITGVRVWITANTLDGTLATRVRVNAANGGGDGNDVGAGGTGLAANSGLAIDVNAGDLVNISLSAALASTGSATIDAVELVVVYD